MHKQLNFSLDATMTTADTIPLRIAKLNQLIEGRLASNGCELNAHIISKDSLLDSLVALHDECIRKYGSNWRSYPKHVSSFMHNGQ